MTDCFLGEVRIYSYNFAPKGWALCNGQTMVINQNQALFALLGTQYGGNGTTTFNLPDFRGRLPIGSMGSGGVSNGEAFGAEHVTLITSELPAHNHQIVASTAASTKGAPAGGDDTFGTTTQPIYAGFNAASVAQLNALAVSSVGGSEPHNNIQPSLVINYSIAISGIFPSRN